MLLTMTLRTELSHFLPRAVIGLVSIDTVKDELVCAFFRDAGFSLNSGHLSVGLRSHLKGA